MKALVYQGPWKMSLEELPEPEPGPGEVLLRPLATGICGSDVHGFTGESGRRKPGMVMGHEVVAEVIGPAGGVGGIRPGDRVAVFNIVGCGGCPHCAAGQEQRCSGKRILGVNAGLWGAMADRFTMPVSALFKLDPGLDPAVGLLAEPIAVALHAIGRTVLSRAATVAIIGTGTIGLGLAIALRSLAVTRVFAFDRLPEKLELAARFGASPVNTEALDAVAWVRQATEGRGVDCAFEAVGLGATVRTAYEVCGAGGTVVLVGNLAREFTLPLQGVTSNEITIHGSYGFTKEDFAQAVALIGKTDLPLPQLISGSCPLEEVPEVMTRMARGAMTPIKWVIRD